MVRRVLAGFLILCGFWATLAQAEPASGWRVAHGQAELVRAEERGLVLAQLVIVDAAEAERLLQPHGLNALRLRRLGTDRYGRERVVATLAGSRDTAQEMLLRAGAALFYPTEAFPQTAKWQAAEASARQAQRGWWRDAPIQSPETTASMPEGFLLVEGVVTRVYRGRDALYLNFGEDWKTDFSIKIPRGAWRAFGKEFTVSEGSRLRGRGSLQSENGPMLVLTRPEQLEVLYAKP